MGVRYIPIKEKAEEWGLTVRRVQMFCKDGEIPGARKVNNQWVMPEDAKRPSDRGEDNSDITIVKPRKRRIENVNSRFISLMSHDMRDSLNTILGYTDMIRKRKDDPELVDKYIDNIQAAGRSMLNLTNNVMEIINVSSNDVQGIDEEVNLDDLIARTCRAGEVESKRRNITVFCSSNVTHKILLMDSGKVERILVNVLSNAIKFSRTNGIVQFDVEEIPAQSEGTANYRYSIADHGVGMSESRLLHIFDSFTRNLADAEGEENHGSGLGMSVVKNLVDYLGGKIEVFSQLDLGTKVVITLNHSIVEDNAVVEVLADLQDLNGKRVLLTEDDELNREIESEILRMAGLEVETAEDGIICVALLDRAAPGYYDFILMDLQMPNMDGISATRFIRSLADKAKSSIPIIAMTAAVTVEDKEEALEAGMNGFVEKPIEINALFGEIRQSLH